VNRAQGGLRDGWLGGLSPGQVEGECYASTVGAFVCAGAIAAKLLKGAKTGLVDRVAMRVYWLSEAEGGFEPRVSVQPSPDVE
jgi:hypothetical protein